MKAHAIPQVGPAPRILPPAPERTILPNGLQLMLVAKRGLPVFDVQLFARGGALFDPIEQAGRASLTAELLDEGTTQHSALQISAELELLGAEMEMRAGWDACFLSLHGLTPRFLQLLDLLAEIALHPTFPPAEFQRKHEERLHSLAQEQDEPRTVAVKALQAAIFGDTHPFGRPLSGTIAAVSALRRDDLAACYESGFAPETAWLLLAGDLDLADAADAVAERFGSWGGGHTPPSALPPVPQRKRRVILIDRASAAQAEVRIGHVGVPRSTPDYFPLLVMNTILGGSFKSRLNMRLREEKGFTYGASTSFAFRRTGGMFSGGAAVFTDATPETLTIIVDEISRLRDELVTAEELERARNYLALGFARNFETTGDIVGNLSEVALHNLPDDYLRTFADRVGAVSRDDVAAAARQYLQPDALSIVVVGDRHRLREPLAELQLGELMEWEAE